MTLYGIADGDVRFDRTNIGTLRSVGSGGESGSRWGLRGTEDLGSGFKATFIFEQGFQIDDNGVNQGNVGGGSSAGFGGTSTQPHSSTGGRLFGRTATVGLAGPFGEIRFGRGYNPLFLIQATADPFGAGIVSQINNLYVNNTVRNDNAVYYDTPRFAGVQVSAVYQLGESSTNTSAPSATGQAKRGNDRYGAGITFANGPVFAGAGYEQIRSNLDTYRIRTADVAATYDFGIVKLHAVYWRTKNGNGNDLLTNGSTVSLNERVYSGGVTVPFGAWTFLGQYSFLHDYSRSNTANTDLGSPRAKNFGVGARYSLSKRTVLYLGYARVNLRNGSSGNAYQGFAGIQDATNFGLYTAANLYGSQTAPAATNDARVLAGGVPINQNINPSSFQLGIRHSF